MSDPPRLRDLAGADDFTRGLLRDAAPTRPFTAADAARLQVAVSKAGAVGSGTWLSASAAPKLAAVALVIVGVGGLFATRRAPPPPAASAHATATSHPPPAPRPTAAAPSPLPLASARVLAPPTSAPTAAPASPRAQTLAADVSPRAVVPAPTPPAAPSTPAAAPSTPRAVTAVSVPAAPLRAAPSPARVALRPAVAPSASTAAPPTLGDEVLAVTQARAALRNNPARAADILAHAERTVTRPQLLDERDLVYIEALVRLGRRAEALDRALALEARAPRSPQSARARALLRAAP